MERYWVESEDLWVADAEAVTWRGRPDGMPVEFVIPIPETRDALVILNPNAGPRTPYGDLKGWPHLLRVRPDGEVVWRIEPGPNPGEHDWWTAVEISEQSIVATTWSCWRQTLDPETGRVLSSVFTK